MHSSILMLGTSFETKGGIASVINVYRAGGLFDRWPIAYVATHSDGSSLTKLIVAGRAYWRFTKHLVKDRSALLHVHSASRASFWRKASFVIPAMWAGHRTIFHLHGGGFMEFYRDDCGPVRKGLIRYVLNNVDRIIVLSESWRQGVADITKNAEVTVISNPSPPSRMDPGNTDRQSKKLLFLGRVSEQKGAYILIDAIADLIREEPDILLVCAGDGDLDSFRREVQKRGLGENVQLVGWVDAPSKEQLLAESTVFVLPSFAEGLPMSLLEAMSAGLPVIATNVGGIPEAITSGSEGILVAPGDVAALTTAIRALLRNPGLRNSLAERSLQKFNTKFRSDVVLSRIDSLYREFGVSPLKAN